MVNNVFTFLAQHRIAPYEPRLDQREDGYRAYPEPTTVQYTSEPTVQYTPMSDIALIVYFVIGCSLFILVLCRGWQQEVLDRVQSIPDRLKDINSDLHGQIKNLDKLYAKLYAKLEELDQYELNQYEEVDEEVDEEEEDKMNKVKINWDIVDDLRYKGLTAESDYVRSLHEELHRTRMINTAMADALSDLQLEMANHQGHIQGVMNDLTREI